MNAAQKSLENHTALEPESRNGADTYHPVASTPASNAGVVPDPSIFPSHLASVVLLSTDIIDVGDSPNRLEFSFESEEFFLLSESILHKGGNVQPIAVRELAPNEIPSDSPLRYRLISGARRLRACAMYRLPVRAIVQQVQPTDELIERLIENHLRQPLSPYELGMQLQHIIETSKRMSRRELARLVGLDASVVQKAIDIAALPQPVIEAFSNASEIQYRDAKPLKDAVAQAREAVLACAQSIQDQDIPSKEVVAKLIQAAEVAAATSSLEVGVEPFNTPPKPFAIEVDGQAIGSFAVDKKGHPEIHLALQLNQRQQADLALLIQKFLHSKVLHPAVRKPVTKKSSPENQTALSNQTAANDAEAVVKERAR